MTKPTPIIDAAIRAGCCRWQEVDRSNHTSVPCLWPACRCDDAEAYIAALRSVCPKEPSAEWLFEVHNAIERVHGKQIDQSVALAAWRAQLLHRELWGDET